MGEVYRARDERLGRDIALKILPAELSNNDEALRRFELEARAASALNHPNIITIYEIEHTDAMAWIAMELIDGEDLGTLIDREPMLLKKAVRIAAKITDGLAAAHDRGIVHRDLKPDNVMLTRDGFVKVLDFGLAKQIKLLSSEDTTLPHTSPGAIFGTVSYMAPEQAAGREMDYRSDQFSFGVILYELLTRRRPFDRETKAETMTAIIREMPPPPSELNEEVPHELDRIVMRCLAKEPRERYASTRDLAHDVREVRDELTHSTRSTARSARAISFTSIRKRRFAWGAVAGALLLIAFAAGAVRMWTDKRAAVRKNMTSIAVTPFRDHTATADGRLLADGISEMVAARLAAVPELRIAAPFDGAAAAAEKRGSIHAVIRGGVQRSGDEIRVSYSLIHRGSGETLLSNTVIRPASELFALEDAVAADLLSALGREAQPRARVGSAALGPEDQRRFVEAVGLLQRVKDEQSVDRAIGTLEALLRNARESGSVNALLARALLYKASLARRPALIEQATVYATRGVTLSPDDAESHVTLGQLRNASGQHAEAVKSFERALTLWPNKPEALVGLANAYEGLGRPAEAEQYFQRVLHRAPDSSHALSRFGAFCYRRGRYEEAEKLFRRVTELIPDAAHAYTDHGGTLLALGRQDEAVAAYERSIRIKPTAVGYSNLGTLQFSRGQYDESRKSFEQAAALAPAEFVIWANLGDACRAAGDTPHANEAYGRAVRAGRAALEIKPNDAYTRSVIALSLGKSGRGAEAHDEIRQALEIDPTDPRVLYKAAVIGVLRGNHDSAISWLERAVAAGYPAGEAERDPDLAPLRSLSAFRNAVKSKT